MTWVPAGIVTPEGIAGENVIVLPGSAPTLSAVAVNPGAIIGANGTTFKMPLKVIVFAPTGTSAANTSGWLLLYVTDVL
jgi:hypothetical protein